MQSANDASAAPAAAATLQPLTFHPIAPTLYVSRPSDPNRIPASASLSSSTTSVQLPPLRSLEPSLRVAPRDVVIFGWMDAPLRLVSKYAVPYTILFPSSNVYIKLSQGKSYFTSERKRAKQLEPLVKMVSAEVQPASQQPERDMGDSTVTLLDASQTLGATSPPASARRPMNLEGMVIHSFSDGGAGNLAQFLSLLPRSAEAPKVCSLIMDSSPGKSSPASGAAAFTMPLAHRPLLRAAFRFLVYLGLWLLRIWTRLRGQLTRAQKMRSTLNALQTWTWITAANAQPQAQKDGAARATQKAPPRMYLYSKSDKLIPWQYVEEHACEFAATLAGGGAPRLVEMQGGEAEKRKLQLQYDRERMEVELRRWDTAPHCGIVQTDFEGYWREVMRFYAAVLSSNARV
ncbi:hypothetical protein ACQY0O_002561 [Thecaphora frezii]